MTDTRTCAQCSTVFEPRREHARFCSARCRVAWNRAAMGESAAEATALQWSVIAMSDTTDRLPTVRAADQPRAFAVISEAVWWVTIVDATLVRYHPEAYDGVLGSQDATERALIEGTLAGLRFVRNQISQDVDHVDFVYPRPAHAASDAITDWVWKSAPEPCLDSLSPRGQAWERERHRAYQAQLAGHTIGEVFDRAAGFLQQAAGQTALLPAGHAIP
jgi:endogenous inhibitor of DNA gyrase (YacG/DUF329 family)